MTFYDKLKIYKNIDLKTAFAKVTDRDVAAALENDNTQIEDFITLISPQAEPYLENIAQRAHALSNQYFGKTMQLYTPMYLGNYCDNRCVYCGFNIENNIPRRVLDIEDVEKEAKYISEEGFEHILILTGSSRSKTPVSYIKDCVTVLKKYFSSIAIEVYAMDQDEYATLINAGVDGLTIYQEVYDQEIYSRVHLAGPKRDYKYRLEAPDRAGAEGVRQINIGALLGLADWRKEVFLMATHAQYLQNKFSDAEIGISVPRLRPNLGSFKSKEFVSDKNIVQIITALRIFLPRIGIAVSTREEATFRENLIPLGVTRLSAGSTTSVGGHTSDADDVNQFDISDERSLKEIIEMLRTHNYQPVLRDWMHI